MTTLTLGTASFGMPGYGIASRHRVTPEDAHAMLHYGLPLDTAAAYGNAEELVGVARLHPGRSAEVTTKILPHLGAHPSVLTRAIEGQVRASRHRLRTTLGDPLTVLFHTPAHGADAAYVAALRECRDGLGLCSAIGTSIYAPEEGLALLSGQNVVQLPYSVLDRRCELAIAGAKGQGLTVQARAPFCQGLLLMEPGDVPDRLAEARPLLVAFRAVCAKYAIGTVEAALRFALDAGADTVVFGVDSFEQLSHDATCVHGPSAPDNWEACREELRAAVPVGDARIVNPSLWSRP